MNHFEENYKTKILLHSAKDLRLLFYCIIVGAAERKIGIKRERKRYVHLLTQLFLAPCYVRYHKILKNKNRLKEHSMNFQIRYHLTLLLFNI